MAEICKLENDILSEKQKEYYHIIEDDEKILSYFSSDNKKVFWHSLIDEKCVSRHINKNKTIRYEISNKHDILLKSYLRFELPDIKIKEKFIDKIRISWCHNIGINIISNCSFNHDGNKFEMDNTWFDIESQFLKTSNNLKNFKKDIGCVPRVENWSSHLEKYIINFDQPWFYSKSHSKSYPMYYFKKSEIFHIYEYKNKIADLLKMQVLINDKWEDIKCNTEALVGITDNDEIPTPELYCCYVNISDQEKEYYTEMEEKKILIEDIISIDIPNPISINENIIIQLNSSSPVKALFWVCENNKKTQLNNYSIYSTSDGKDPVKFNSLSYADGSLYKFKDFPSDIFNKTSGRYNFLNTPDEIGYHGYATVINPTEDDNYLGINLTNLRCRLELKLLETKKQQNIDNNLEELLKGEIKVSQEQTQEYEKFNIKVRILSIKEFTIKNNKDNFILVENTK